MSDVSIPKAGAKRALTHDVATRCAAHLMLAVVHA
jgi:hypothetical protein